MADSISFREAVDVLGKRPAARVAGVTVNSVCHWYATGRPPKWRGREVGRIIRAAEQARLEAGRPPDA